MDWTALVGIAMIAGGGAVIALTLLWLYAMLWSLRDENKQACIGYYCDPPLLCSKHFRERHEEVSDE